MPFGKLCRTTRALARALYCLHSTGRADSRPEGTVHEHRNPSGRSDIAGPSPAGARPAACPCDVRRCGRRSPDHRPSAETSAGGRGLSDQRGFVRLRACHAGAMHRLSRRRHPAACNDGCYLCLGRPDAVDGRRARYRPARHLWLRHCCWNLWHPCRPFHQPAAAALSARGDRHDHPGDRHFADASGYQLGRRRAANVEQGGRRRSRRVSQSGLWANCKASASRCSCCWSFSA